MRVLKDMIVRYLGSFIWGLGLQCEIAVIHTSYLHFVLLTRQAAVQMSILFKQRNGLHFRPQPEGCVMMKLLLATRLLIVILLICTWPDFKLLGKWVPHIDLPCKPYVTV
jgi:hypothetical protein